MCVCVCVCVHVCVLMAEERGGCRGERDMEGRRGREGGRG